MAVYIAADYGGHGMTRMHGSIGSRCTAYGIVTFSLSALIVILVCAASLPVSAQDSDATARDQVMALEKAWNQAYKAGDTTALSSIL
jgi:hypothetical protein